VAYLPREPIFMNVAAASGVAVLLILIWVVPVMGYNSTRPQPVPFSHKHHVSRLGSDAPCRAARRWSPAVL
jgi:hypothetical protein